MSIMYEGVIVSYNLFFEKLFFKKVEFILNRFVLCFRCFVFLGDKSGNEGRSYRFVKLNWIFLVARLRV